MKQQLEEIKSRAAAALANAKLPQEIDELRVRFLGKKGELTGILKQMGKLSPEERPVIASWPTRSVPGSKRISRPSDGNQASQMAAGWKARSWM